MSPYCPECDSQVRRSRVRGMGERLLKALSPYRVYRCRECGWRGWLSEQARPRTNWRNTLQAVLSALVVIFLNRYLVSGLLAGSIK